ncbi:MAG: phenylalanine--tRNA ligase subunit alpha [Nitrospinae bacterium]|nr:phenylalanine--tRNA ligase subunit alpha [Nitrospinota bacterium]
MKAQLEAWQHEAETALQSLTDEKGVDQLRVRYLGKKGRITLAVREVGKLPPAERPLVGKIANDVKTSLERLIAARVTEIRTQQLERALLTRGLDVTLPGRIPPMGSKHPLTQVLEEVTDIFQGLGFRVAEGPEVELDYYNFEALNIPRDHPARDMQDTFYISEEVVLRTHTSPVQIRVMEKQQPPIRIICPGKVYRVDADVRHSPMFHQIEGLLVDRNISLADLKGVLEVFVEQFFRRSVNMRFRAGFFPFTEPSAEVDIQCVKCQGSGCPLCGSGWLEILGAGMVNPVLYSFVGYDPEEVTGFAFGMGAERLAMLKYGIDDIRLFYENDLRFLQQF